MFKITMQITADNHRSSSIYVPTYHNYVLTYVRNVYQTVFCLFVTVI